MMTPTIVDRIPANISEPCKGFLDEHFRLSDVIELYGFGVQTLSNKVASIIEFLEHQIEQIKQNLEPSISQTVALEHQIEQIKQNLEPSISQTVTLKDMVADELSPVTRSLSEQSATFFEMVLCRSVDNFLTFISQLLFAIYRANPEVLLANGESSYKLKEILRFSNYNELIQYIVEKRVTELSYQSFHILSDELSKKHGFTLTEDTATRQRATELNEYRNLLVHNRGIVNHHIVSRLPGLSNDLGQRLHIDGELTGDSIMFLARFGLEIEQNAVSKFSLQTPVPKSSVVNHPLK